ncbi:MAG: hypothetical protein D6714_17000 [Bacteroidetes bacterium]|nr:MAG: hypothetical protein D6714_17000 [Bacteroidota bacterium]
MKYLLTFFPLFFSMILAAQNAPAFKNPSFEGKPQHSHLPEGWRNCSLFKTTSPPDTQPGFFDVELPAADGKTYISMVVRKNGTWEAIGQALTRPLLRDSCYRFQIMLGRSKRFESPAPGGVRPNGDIRFEQYTDPVILRIWGGDRKCERAQLLAQTDPIAHFGWELYQFVLQPEQACLFITFEVFSPGKAIGETGGHLLLDAASDFVPVSCQEK